MSTCKDCEYYEKYEKDGWVMKCNNPNRGMHGALFGGTNICVHFTPKKTYAERQAKGESMAKCKQERTKLRVFDEETGQARFLYCSVRGHRINFYPEDIKWFSLDEKNALRLKNWLTIAIEEIKKRKREERKELKKLRIENLELFNSQ